MSNATFLMNMIEELLSSFNYVHNPENSFSFESPDFLVAKKGKLYGLFIPKKNEKSVNKLLIRLAASKIVYPANMFTVLILHKENTHRFNQELTKNHFDIVMSSDDLKELPSIVRKKETRPQEYQYEIKITQQKIFERFSILYTENLRFIRQKKDFTGIKLKLKSLEARKTKVFKLSSENKPYTYNSNIYKINKLVLGYRNLSQYSHLQSLRAFYNYSVISELRLTEGIPVGALDKIKVLDINRVPYSKFDPLKPIRIASLTGWLIFNSNNYSEIEKFYEKREIKINESFTKKNSNNDSSYSK